METTSSLLKSVSRRVWSAPQRPFRVCSWNRETRKGVTAGTLEELKQRAAHALLIPILLSLVCEEDGTEVDSDEFLMALPDNTVFMCLKPGQIWKPHPPAFTLFFNGQDPHRTTTEQEDYAAIKVVSFPRRFMFFFNKTATDYISRKWLGPRGSSNIKPADSKPRNGRDIAQVTFDLYRLNPKDVFGSLNVKATFQGLYSVSADFQCLGPKKVIREALRMISTVLQAAGHMLITSATVIRRIIQGADLLEAQGGRQIQIEHWQ